MSFLLARNLIAITKDGFKKSNLDFKSFKGKGLSADRRREINDFYIVIRLCLKNAEGYLKLTSDEQNYLNFDFNKDVLYPLITANYMLGYADGEMGGHENLSKLKSSYAKLGLVKNQIRKTKQEEKLFVKECWQNWQNNPKQYKNKTVFATAMIDKFRPEDPDDENKHLSSVKKITEWCTTWEREKTSLS